MTGYEVRAVRPGAPTDVWFRGSAIRCGDLERSGSA
jgi:hypothetical protein